MQNKFKAGKILVFLTIFLFTLYYFQTLYFVATDHTPPHWDYAAYLKRSLDALTAFGQGQLLSFISAYDLHPPGAFLLLGFLFLLLGYSKTVVVLFNFVLLALLLITVYRFIEKLEGKITAGLSSLLILNLVATGKILNIKLHEFMLDFPQAVGIIVVYVGVYYAIKTNSFSLKQAIFLAFVCAYVLWIKAFGGIFLIIPIIFYGFAVFKFNRVWLFYAFLMTTLVVAAGWYFPHLSQLLPFWFYFTVTEGHNWGNPQGLAGIIFYLKSFIYFGGARLIFLAPPLWYRVKKTAGNNLLTKFILTSFVFPFLLFALLMGTKDARYLFPTFITVLLAGFWGTMRIIPKNRQKQVGALVAAYALVSTVNYLPQGHSVNSALEVTAQTWSSLKPKTVAYFFENDATSFNYSNVTLLHEEKSYREEPFPTYEHLNNFASLENGRYNAIASCTFSVLPDMVVVYKGEDDPRSGIKERASFEDLCPTKLRNQLELFKSIKLIGETLLFYKNKTFVAYD